MIPTYDEAVELIYSLNEDLLDQGLLYAMDFQVFRDEGTGAACLESGDLILVTGDPALSPFVRSFCREWPVGGPLIAHYGIHLAQESEQWSASWRALTAHGPTPLVAAVRVILLYVFLTGTVLQDFRGLSRPAVLQKIFSAPLDQPGDEADDLFPAG